VSACNGIETSRLSGSREENDFGTARSPRRDNNWAKTHWKRRDVSDYVCSERAWAFGFSGVHQNRDDPNSFGCRLEAGIQNHQFDTVVLYPCAVYEFNPRFLTRFAFPFANTNCEGL